MKNEDLKLAKETTANNSEIKNAKALFAFGYIFYIIGAVVMLYAIIQLINGDMDFIHSVCCVCGALFTASWGAILMGLGSIVKMKYTKLTSHLNK